MGGTSLSSEHAFEEAGRSLLGTIMSGGLWVDALEVAMPRLGCLGGSLLGVMPPRLSSLPTRAVTDTFEAIAAGRTPPLTASTRIKSRPEDGFLCDQMDVFREARARSPFYLEFMRPRGLAYQASAHLDGDDRDTINLALFRGPRSGGFTREELRTLSLFLPYVRAATMAFRGRLQIEADRCAAPFVERGEVALQVAYDGTIRSGFEAALETLAPVIMLRNRRLVLSATERQRDFDVALATTLVQRRPNLVSVAGDGRNWLRLLILPVLGQALDVFQATAALIVVLDTTRPTKLDERIFHLLADAVGLTRREIEVIRLVTGGFAAKKIADQLKISYETVRLHLKNASAKLGVHSQAEMTALVNRVAGY